MKHYFLFLMAWVLLWGFIVTGAALSSIPYNPLSPGYGNKTKIMTFMPQGWGFFSRNPREEDLFVFEYRNNGWQKRTSAPISNIHNYFGIDRFPRAQSVEIAMLTANLKEGAWKNCQVNINAMDLKDTAAFSVDNPTPFPTLKGKLCIVRQQPVPWAWAWNESRLKMPAKYTIIQIHQH